MGWLSRCSPDCRSCLIPCWPLPSSTRWRRHVFALSYNMLLGQGGMLSFGHAVYFGLGGFMAVHALVMIEFETVYSLL